MSPTFAFAIILLSHILVNEVFSNKLNTANIDGSISFACTRTQWEAFKKVHAKEYHNHAEDRERFSHFCRKSREIYNHNANQEATYKMGINRFADWTESERSQLSSLKTDAGDNYRMLSHQRTSLNDGELPTHFDWSTQPKIVSPVRYQGHCGSCWAFATIGMLEGQERPKSGESLTELSEQNLIDCNETGDGCDGGDGASALVDLKRMGGVMRRSDYPYVSDDTRNRGVCKMNDSKIVPFTSKFGDIVRIQFGEEELLKRKLYEYGPIMVQYHTSQEFHAYESGVFHKPDCPLWGNHMMLLVGYGTDALGQDYWKVKNSWSEGWGQGGYGFVARNRDNNCGIATRSFIILPNW